MPAAGPREDAVGFRDKGKKLRIKRPDDRSRLQAGVLAAADRLRPQFSSSERTLVSKSGGVIFSGSTKMTPGGSSVKTLKSNFATHLLALMSILQTFPIIVSPLALPIR